MGDIDGARFALQKAILLNPRYSIAHHRLSYLKTYDYNDEQFRFYREVYLDSTLTDFDRCHFGFALAKMCEDMADFNKAFTYLTQANAAQKKARSFF